MLHAAVQRVLLALVSGPWRLPQSPFPANWCQVDNPGMVRESFLRAPKNCSEKRDQRVHGLVGAFLHQPVPSFLQIGHS